MDDAWLKILFGVLNWFTIVVGWYVVSGLSDVREDRKECRAPIDLVRDNVLEIEREAYNFLGTPASGAIASLEIRRSLAHLTKLLGVLEYRYGHLSFDPEMIDLRRAVTGGDFDSATRTARSAGDPLYERISTAALSLTTRMEGAFADSFVKRKLTGKKELGQSSD